MTLPEEIGAELLARASHVRCCVLNAQVLHSKLATRTEGAITACEKLGVKLRPELVDIAYTPVRLELRVSKCLLHLALHGV